MIIYKSFFNIDVRNSCVKKIPIPDDFEFFDEYIDFAVHNDNIKLYRERNPNTTVVHCISGIMSLMLQGDVLSDAQRVQLNQFAHSIAEKLLAVEQDVQQEIDPMGSQVKKGNLLQVINKNENDEYVYIIAKVDNSLWYDSDNLKKSLGFSGEKKNVWKSAAFTLAIDNDEVKIVNVKVYVDTNAKYWASRFLELVENRNDHSNTYAAVSAMDSSLKRTVKQKSEKDYYLLRNSLIQRLKVPHLVNYAELVSDLLDGYVPEDSELDIDKVRSSLLELPEKRKFDTQFNSDPTAVNKRSHFKFPIIQGIELRVPDDMTNFNQFIHSKEDANGRRFIEIECQDERTYNTFKDNITVSV